MPRTPIIVALDYPDLDQAKLMLARLSPAQCQVKIGKELFTRAGPAAVACATDLGFKVFLDMKFHDIPATVAGACRAAADLGVWMANVHASGGAKMMDAAREALANSSVRPLLIGVTVLTSFGQYDLQQIGIDSNADEQVLRLALLAADCGLDGVVCSPREAKLLRAQLPAGFLLVTPGVRPLESGSDDQVRVATPSKALRDGANYLVIGRPITKAADPPSSLASILDECQQVLLETGA
ncbi:MAG: orotidine-5'-phosphate decarboxylase [Pseudomonadota bacterium]